MDDGGKKREEGRERFPGIGRANERADKVYQIGLARAREFLQKYQTVQTRHLHLLIAITGANVTTG